MLPRQLDQISHASTLNRFRFLFKTRRGGKGKWWTRPSIDCKRNMVSFFESWWRIQSRLVAIAPPVSPEMVIYLRKLERSFCLSMRATWLVLFTMHHGNADSGPFCSRFWWASIRRLLGLSCDIALWFAYYIEDAHSYKDVYGIKVLARYYHKVKHYVRKLFSHSHLSYLWKLLYWIPWKRCSCCLMKQLG